MAAYSLNYTRCNEVSLCDSYNFLYDGWITCVCSCSLMYFNAIGVFRPVTKSARLEVCRRKEAIAPLRYGVSCMYATRRYIGIGMESYSVWVSERPYYIYSSFSLVCVCMSKYNFIYVALIQGFLCIVACRKISNLVFSFYWVASHDVHEMNKWTRSPRRLCKRMLRNGRFWIKNPVDRFSIRLVLARSSEEKVWEKMIFFLLQFIPWILWHTCVILNYF